MSYRTLMVKRTKRTEVRLEVTDEQDSDISWMDEDEQRRLADGSLGMYLMRVTVSVQGVTLGTDYLGGCCYTDPRDFRRENIGDRSYLGDMVREAIGEARSRWQEICGANLRHA